jgi:hypothetical protein
MNENLRDSRYLYPYVAWRGGPNRNGSRLNLLVKGKLGADEFHKLITNTAEIPGPTKEIVRDVFQDGHNTMLNLLKSGGVISRQGSVQLEMARIRFFSRELIEAVNSEKVLTVVSRLISPLIDGIRPLAIGNQELVTLVDENALSQMLVDRNGCAVVRAGQSGVIANEDVLEPSLSNYLSRLYKKEGITTPAVGTATMSRIIMADIIREQGLGEEFYVRRNFFPSRQRYFKPDSQVPLI